MPQSAKMAARPRRNAHYTISRWKSNSLGFNSGTTDNPLGVSTIAFLDKNSEYVVITQSFTGLFARGSRTPSKVNDYPAFNL
jgi:hypothetical protein